jgi:hypothetical protein
MTQIVISPTIADGIPSGKNQLSTGVIFSNMNRKGIVKSVSEQIDSTIPYLFISRGMNNSHPNGTDRIVYADHVICPVIATSTMTQVNTEIKHVTEKDLRMSFLYLFISHSPK